MRFTVNKDTKIIELLPSVFTAEELLELVEQFKDFSFSVSFSAQKSEKQGMVVGNAYVPIISTIDHS